MTPPSTSRMMMTDTPLPTPSKRALVVRGGWDGHQPVEATELFLSFLHANAYEVRVEESPAVYSDAGYLSTVDLIVQSNTMASIEAAEFAGPHPYRLGCRRHGLGRGRHKHAHRRDREYLTSSRGSHHRNRLVCGPPCTVARVAGHAPPALWRNP
jgi:hypothetical protein